MKKMFFTIITSMMFLFVIWVLILGFKNNWNLYGMRFSLRATMQQLEEIKTTNFEELMNYIDKTLKAQELLIKANSNQWYSGLINQTITLGTIGTIIFVIIEYAIALISTIGAVLNFIFNPVVY